MRKICVVITARPSYSRVRSLLIAIREHPNLDLQLVVAASAVLSRYGSTVKTIEEEGFHVDRSVYTIMEGENLLTSAKSTGIGLSELATASCVAGCKLHALRLDGFLRCVLVSAKLSQPAAAGTRLSRRASVVRSLNQLPLKRFLKDKERMDRPPACYPQTKNAKQMSFVDFK